MTYDDPRPKRSPNALPSRADDTELFIFGSQALLGEHPEAPPSKNEDDRV